MRATHHPDARVLHRAGQGYVLKINLDRRGAQSRHTVDAVARAEPLFWQLVRENSELVDLRRFSKQVAGLGFFHQCRSHPAIEMRVAPGFVVERVEDGKRGRSLLDGKPRDRAHLSVHQGYGGTQKIRDLFLLARLRPQRNIQCKFCPHILLS